MAMEITGEVIAVLQTETGQGKKGEWKKQSAIIETPGQYPTKVAVELWNDKVGVLSTGDIATVSFNPESREFNSRWYTTLRVWKVDKTNSTPTSKPSNTPPVSNFDDSDDSTLPF